MDKDVNVIFIITDALRAKNLGCYRYKKAVSPHIDELASKGILLEDAFSCTNYTDPSITTIFSGRYPLAHQILNHGPRVTDVEVEKFNRLGIALLPEILKENGYATLAIDWLWRWHKRGYDYYSGARPRSSLHGFMKQQVRKFPALRRVVRQSIVNKLQAKVFRGRSKSYEDAKSVTDQAMKLIKEKGDRKIFLLLHYWDSHSPYLPPREYVRNYSRIKDRMEELFRYFTSDKLKEEFDIFKQKVAESKAEIIASYDGEISFVDHEIGRLIDFLNSHNILQNSLIVLTSDHGESLVEHEIYLDHHGLYDETIHVPLIFVHPKLPKGKRIKGFVQHFDIVPTILDILNMKVDIDFDGRSILPLIDGNQLHSAVYAEESQWERKRAIRTEEWKYIYALSERDAVCRKCGRIHGALEELYNLVDDPEETQNVIEKEPQVASELRNRIEDWIKRFDYEELSTEETGKTYREDMEKVEERLKGLGYI